MTLRLARGSAPRRLFAPAAWRPLASYSAQATVDKRPGMAYKHAKAEAVSAQKRGKRMNIKITRSACDGVRDTRTFKTIQGARAFAVKYVGEHPEMGGDYAVNGDGVATIRVQGATLKELFDGVKQAEKCDYRTVRESDGDDWFIYVVYFGAQRLKAFDTAFEAADYIGECKQYDAYCEADMA